MIFNLVKVLAYMTMLVVDASTFHHTATEKSDIPMQCTLPPCCVAFVAVKYHC